MTDPIANPLPYVVGPVERVVNHWSIPARLAIANRIAAVAAQHRPMRELAEAITRGANFMPSEAPTSIAEFIRGSILYQQEEREVLQGPYTTLPTMQIGPYTLTGRGAGDCDDLAILFATLCRACGIKAWVVGVGPGRAPVHAVGMTADGTLYELTDQRYGGPETQARAKLPPNWRAWSYDPETGQRVAGRVVSRPGRAIVQWRPDDSMRGIDQVAGVVADLEGLGIGQLPGPIGNIASTALSAAGTAAAVGGQAASLATSLGLGAAAVPVVGWAVAGAALIGVGVAAIAKAAKKRRVAGRAALNVQEWIATLEGIISAPADRRPLLKMRLLELIPRMAGTGVQVATYRNERATSGLAWADGSTGQKQGVLGAYRNKVSDQAAALDAHAASAQTFARALASMPVLVRQGAVRLALETYLPGGLTGMDWLPPVPGPGPDEGGREGGRVSEAKRPIWPWLVGAGLVGAYLLMED